MGQLKQLLPFGNGTLLSHAIEVAREAGFSPIIVVLGAQAERVEESIRSLPVEIVHNPDWRLGMGSSVSVGMKHILEAGTEAVALLVGDQPRVPATRLIAMRTLLESGPALVVAAAYNDTLGVPAIFKRALFTRLAALKPQAGAKSLLFDKDVPVTAYELPEAAIDIDTPEDFAKQCRSEPMQL